MVHIETPRKQKETKITSELESNRQKVGGIKTHVVVLTNTSFFDEEKKLCVWLKKKDNKESVIF